MTIALDYDGTYTADPAFWDQFIGLAKNYGHTVICITKRGPDNQGLISINGIDTIHSNRKAKWQFLQDLHTPHIDIWIDDDPINLFREG